VKRGIGVMLDDALAGLYALLVLQAAAAWIGVSVW
jgi:phosphatidylglycerophosphatase A